MYIFFVTECISIDSISRSGVYLFFTQLLLKMSVFELNKCFTFQQTLAFDKQSIVEFLDLIHDFHTSGSKVISSVFIFLIVSGRGVSS